MFGKLVHKWTDHTLDFKHVLSAQSKRDIVVRIFLFFAEWLFLKNNGVWHLLQQPGVPVVAQQGINKA